MKIIVTGASGAFGRAAAASLIERIDPAVLLTLGRHAARTLLREDSPMGAMRGRVFDYRGVPLVATYHPAALLRNPGWIRPVWEDLQRLRALLDGETARV